LSDVWSIDDGVCKGGSPPALVSGSVDRRRTGGVVAGGCRSQGFRMLFLTNIARKGGAFSTRRIGACLLYTKCIRVELIHLCRCVAPEKQKGRRTANSF
ncbi:hypothetical protein CSUI_002067, partial [Cystoisospora suis]